MLLPLFLLQLLWELRLPGLARAHPLLLVLVLVGTNMRLVVGPLVVLMQLVVLARARLLMHGLLNTKLYLVMALLVVLVQVLVGDWPLLPWLAGEGLTVELMLQLVVLVGRVLLMVGRGLQLLVLVGGHMLLLGRQGIAANSDSARASAGVRHTLVIHAGACG
jgi:hypothetical protein